ncbi:MAG: RNA-binding transcriptional accessory protein, partial [Pirellulales bacterium]|nr:RNA-binding transcriptional accessory protein [Pirellulales bacterium]
MTAILTTDVNLSRVAHELGLRVEQVTSTVELLDDGNTVPFITRYRKDQTDGLNEEQIEQIRNRVTAMRLLTQRKQTILRSIESQGKLTEELRHQIERADHVRRLEDLYLPFKPKKQTLATRAIEQGLEPLAREIIDADKTIMDLDGRAADFVNEDKGIATPAEALLGAGHIVAEKFSEQAELRQRARKIFRSHGKLTSTKAKEDHKRNEQFRDYHAFSEPLNRVPPHRIMAVNRGEKAGVLRVRIETDTAEIHRMARALLVPADHPLMDFLTGCVTDAIDRLILPSLEREVRRELSEKAEMHAVEVFARNLRKLLLAPPVSGRRILAMDPGFKTGCKLAAIDEYGKPLAHAIVHIVGKEDRIAQAKGKIVELIRDHQLNTIAIGNGTACRETEQLVGTLLGGELAGTDVAYVIVNEAGASVYSTSALGREELPDCDAMQRSAISIGRRLQDPLSELVKIDPASIGVG